MDHEIRTRPSPGGHGGTDNAVANRTNHVAAARRAVVRCRARERKLVHQITSAVKRGARNKARYFSDVYMKSGAAKVVAVLEADRKLLEREREREQRRKNGSSRPLRQPLTPQEALDLAAEISPYEGCDEPVTARHKFKPSGGSRTIMGIGVRKRATQLMAKRVLTSFFDPHPGQYALRGGKPAACAAVWDALERGYKWAVHADVRDCFGSLQHQGLMGILPLPRRVVENVVFCDDSDVVAIGEARLQCLHRIRDFAGDQRSVPQGSSVSSVVAETALKPLLEGLPENGLPILQPSPTS